MPALHRIASWMLILFVLIGPAFAEWSAYNDCIRTSGGDNTAANVTDWTIYNGYDTHNSGFLIDLQTGADLPVSVTFTMLNGLAVSNDSGANPVAGTDAYAVFHRPNATENDWIVDLSGGILYYGQPGWFVDITFSGLNPSKYYTFVGTAIRGRDYPLRESLFTISGHQSAENNSSPGVVAKTPTTTTLLAGGNQYANTGFVVRWDKIQVSSSGTFTIRAEASPNAVLNDSGRAYPFGAFLLREVGEVVVEPAGDLNDDDAIDLVDLMLLASEWLTDGTAADLNGDHIVNLQDLAILASNWQKSWKSGSLQATLTPAGAVAAGAKWCVDGGEWKDSGATITAIPIGSHTVSFSDAAGYTTPAEQTVTILQNQTLSISADYILKVGAVQTTILPQAAIDAGAQWRLDGGAWQNHDATVTDVPAGSHTIEFSAIDGWITPASQAIEVVLGQMLGVTGTYERQTGTIQVAILPQGAIDAGAQWRIDGGTWNASGQTVSGVIVGEHTVEFGAAAGYIPPQNQTVLVEYNQTTTATGTYALQTGSLQATIAPQGAIDDGAQWRVDGGTWRAGGSLVEGLAVGNHSVEYSSIAGWNTPQTQTVVVLFGATAATTGTYVRQTGSLQVVLEPAAAITAGAQWRVDGGNWQVSGATVGDLFVGQHTVEFNEIAGYTKPGNQLAEIAKDQTAILTGTYTQQTGSLQVTLSPAAAVTAGAQWRVDGGTWQAGGATVSNLAVGAHTVEYLSVTGWDTPAEQSVTITHNQTTTISGSYTEQTGSLTVTISPQAAIDAGAQWRVDGGAWQISGATVGGLVIGSHTVEFKEATGFTTPASQTPTLQHNQTATVTGAYVLQTGSIQTTITPQGAIDAGARWRVDGGAWQTSGATVSGLAIGSHTVEFNSIAEWNNPATQSATVSFNQTTAVSGAYVRHVGSLQTTISPQGAIDAGAQWRITGDIWRSSGATVGNLPTGSYSVDYSAVSGWNPPAPQTVMIFQNQITTTAGIYELQTGSLQVTITPSAAVTAGAQWRVDGGAWQAPGTTVSGLAVGMHTVDYKAITGWITPETQSVAVSNQQTATAVGVYGLQTGALQITIAPQGAIDAQARWRVDGGAWQLSDAVVGGLAVGGHAVEFNAITGYDSPGGQTVQVQNGQTTTLTATYILHTGSITVTIVPQGAIDAGAYWRADNGPWRGSGTTLTPVAIGWHEIEYLPISGWTTPTAQNILVQKDATTATTGTYGQVLTAALTISEFMADNKANFSTQMTAGGATIYPDWIEIYNPTDTAVNLEGWSLKTGGNRWIFPSILLASGQYLIVCATGQPDASWPVLDANGYYHTNFRLDSSGEYLGLLAPDGTIIFEYPDGYPQQLEDLSYGKAQYITPLIDSGAGIRWRVPTVSDPTGWTQASFDDSGWTAETTPLGFGASADPGMVAYYPMNEGSGTVAYDKLGSHNGTLRGTVTWVAGPLNGALGTALNFAGNSGDYLDIGNWNPSAATGQLSISHWVKWSGSGNTWQGTIGKRDTWNASDMMWQIELQTNSNPAGYTTLKQPNSYPAYGFTMPVNQWIHLAMSFDGTLSTMYLNGASIGSDLFSFASDTASALTIGACEANGGNPWKGAIDDVRIYDRALTAAEVGRLAEGKGLSNALETQMLNLNASCRMRQSFQVEDPAVFDGLALRIRYEDGFVAYLNGQKVAERNAPTTLSWNSTATTDRPDGESLSFEEINLTAYLGILQATPAVNVLAIQGLNNAAGNGEYLIEPVLVATQDLDTAQYFTTPTPGSANISGALGIVEEIEFSHKRGFYAAGFSLTLASDTPGAEIRYTLDGTAPSATTGTVYTGPIAISATSIVRAMGFKPGWLDSAVKTHTYLFIADILQQSPTGAAPSADWPAAGTFNNQVMNYGMDPDIVTVDSRYKTLVDDALVAIPSLSIVTDPNHLFNAGNGIYVNASQDGRAWERPVSLELIDPSGNDGFQINCGLRIRGGYSRSGDNPKHAFRVFFRGEYGEGKLNYPLFGDEGADSFDKVDIQTSQNYSWSFGGDSRNTMCREIFSRDTQRAMGQPYTRSRYYHLYLNGQYWGLYLTQERCEARYAETYFGGSKDDYDVVKVEAGSYTINATDGTLDKWQTIFNALDTFKNAEPYFRFQGLNTDGTANASYERFLDIDNLIDYMICTYYVGDFDGPVSNFLGNTSPNNFYGIYNRVHPDGFKFFRHDAEHSLFDDNSWGIDRTGPFPAGQTFDKFNPQYLSQKLAENIEYRVRFGDRVHKYFYNGGLLTSSSASQRFLARAATIDTAIIAESARWGDSKTSTNLNRNDHWLPQINYISGTYMNNRPAIVLNQLIGKGWYPNVAAPSFSPFGGYVNPGYSLTMSNPGGGDLYYTLDGTDPRKYSHLSTPGADVTLAAESAAKKVFVPTTEPVSALGAIRADYWFGISGTAVSNLTSNANYPDNPSLTEYRTVFESRTGDPWDQYGARLSGYLHPPVTGNYTFWIASDDGGELWLSTTESPTNAVKIAQVSGWTGTRQWDWYAEQKSAAIPLTAGQKYYIYALMKEEGGGDNLSVAWQGPNITRQVIDGQNLSPAGNPWMNIVYDDSGWTAGSGTVGFETRPSDPVNYTDLIDMDLQTAMYTKNASCYIRIPFTAPNLDYSSLTLKVRYDDGFIAYLNGAEVKRVNFDSAAAPVWNSAANTSHTDALAREFESFDLTAHLGKLKKGATNMLAIQGLNITAGNNDFLLGAELVAGQISPGDPSATAIRYTGPVTLTQSTAVKARALNGKWSALNEAVFAIGPVKESLRITEIMYNPAILNTEYIELQNVGTSSINLNLVRFTRGIDFTFGDTTLAPGGAVLVVQDVAAFEAFYGTGLPIAGHYTGLLDNAGERIQLVDAIGTVIHDFEYKDGWYDITDGPGFSLTILDPSASDLMVWGQKSGWRASAMAYGSPGSDDMGLVPGPGAVVINEILSHSHGGEITPDWIELHNTTDEPINIGGWFLSDSNIDDPNKMKYEIASDTILPRNGFAVFYQDLHFGNPADPGCHAPFALSEGGETIYLQSGQGGALTGYTVEQQFDAAESGVAFGRYIKSSLDGGVNFVAMSANTPGYGNAAPKVGPIVITEMMYNPNSANTGDEYIELKNISGAPVTLQDEVGTETSPGVFRTDIVPWQFTNGIEFAFPANTTIPAGGYLIVCKDKTKLKAYYGAAIPSSVTILQWTSGSLDNAGEKVRLSKPGDQELGQDRYWIRAEQISYDDVAPWPVEPDGTGKVLQRIDPTAYGNDAANWQAGDPSPGKQ